MTTPSKTQNSKFKTQKFLLLIISLAIVLRIALALIHPFTFPDSKDYDALARTIVEHRAYQVDGLYASRMPGYPAFIAAIYFLCGYSIKAVLAVQAFLGGATVWLVYLIGRRFDERVAVVAAALIALDPLSIAFSASLLSETPFALCLVASVYCCMRLLDKARFWPWFALALLWNAALQLRAEVLGCILALGFAVYFCARERKSKVVHFCGLMMTAILMGALMIPWQNRCEKLFGATIHFTTLEGISLYEAVYPEATGGPRQDLIPLPADMKLLNEAQRNDEWSRRAWQYIKNDPARIAGLALKKIARTWSPFLNAAEFQNLPLQLALALWNLPLFFLALYGLFRAAFPLKIKLLLLTPILYFTAVHALFLGSVRYRVPLTPLLCLLAAAALIHLRHRLKSPQQPPIPTV